MFNVVPYKEEHVFPLLSQAINTTVKDFFLSGQGQSLERSPNSFSLIKDGVPLVCGGILEIWQGRGQIWCVFNEDSKENFVPVFRHIQRFLKEQQTKYNRIEVCIPHYFDTGVRRALMLGFKIEIDLAPKFLPDGTDCTVLVMVGV